MTASPIYDDYAAVYDRTGQLRFSILTANYLPDVLRAHPVAGRRLLDLACGTGTFAVMQAEAGWLVTGLDQSATMLTQAKRKAESAGVEIAWLVGDLRAFQLPEPVDLVTCWYDSLNYLLEPTEVEAAFCAMAAALVPGGIVCCDVATDYFLQNYWQGVEVQETPDYLQVMQSSYGPAASSTLVLTGWHKRPDGRWDRFREVHVERGYPADFWQHAITAAGLAVVGYYDCFTLQPPNERSLRLCWVARKPHGDGEP